MKKGKKLTENLAFINGVKTSINKKEFFTVNNRRTIHIRHIRFQEDFNNNKMERQQLIKQLIIQ